MQEKQTMLMIHGMWASGWIWNAFREYFESKGYRCIAPSLRFHGVEPSDAPPPELGSTSILDYAEDLEKEVKSFGEPVIVMGHSMGGLLGQILAARVNIHALILMAPAPPSGIFSLNPSTVRCFLSEVIRWGFWKRPIRPNFAEMAYSVMNKLPEEQRREAYDNLIYESGRAAYEIGLPWLDKRGASRVDESRVNCPVLALAGGEDRMIPPSLVAKIARKYGATYREFPGHGHLLLLEPGWHQVAEYVANWLLQIKR